MIFKKQKTIFKTNKYFGGIDFTHFFETQILTWLEIKNIKHLVMEITEQRIHSNNNSNPVSRTTSIVVPPISYRCAIFITFMYSYELLL